MTSKNDFPDSPEAGLYNEESAPISQNDSDSNEASAMEIVSNEERTREQASATNLRVNSRRSWLPWKRPNRRDQQLSQLREGYVELIELIRSISGHLEWQKKENSQVSSLVQSLPPVLNSFEKLATSQQQVTAILGRINSHMEDSSLKDQRLLENMQGFNSTIKEVSVTNHNALGTLNQVQDRIGQSDERMTVLFQQASQTNEVVGDMMMRLEKRLFLSNVTLIVLLVLLMSLGIFFATRGGSPELQKVASTPENVAVANEQDSERAGAEVVNETPLRANRELERGVTSPPIVDSSDNLEETVLFPGLSESFPEEVFGTSSEAEEDELPAFSIPFQ